MGGGGGGFDGEAEAGGFGSGDSIDLNREGLIAGGEGDPGSVLERLPFVGFDAAFGVVVPLADGFDKDESVEFAGAEIEFKPAGSLTIFQIPCRVEISVIGLVGADGIGRNAGMDRATRGEVLGCDDVAVTNLGSGAGVLPGFSDFTESSDDVRGELAFAVGGSVEKEVAVGFVLRDQPFIDDRYKGFEGAVFVAGFPEPTFSEGDTGLGGD